MNSTDNFPAGTSGYHDSYWTDSVERPAYPALEQDLNTDIVIVGAGIAGLTTAYCLVKEGMRVVVIEDGFIGSGETGRSTAHIVNVLDDRYSEIEKTFGAAKAKLAAESHTAAIRFIENLVRTEDLKCDFKRVSGYLFTHQNDKAKTLQREFEAVQKAGIRAELLSALPGVSSYSGEAIHFPDQAQFHPMKYLSALARLITEDGGMIFCNTHADRISSEGIEANGYRVTAQEVVVATNSPVNDLVTMHTKQHAYRTYVIAAEIPKGSLPPALWWDTGDPDSAWVSKPYHYVRTQPFNDQSDLLIVGGEDHKTGQSQKENVKEEERYSALEQWAMEHFPMISNVAYQWSGQVMEPVDMLGFIGVNPGDENIYIATGDSGNGITHGTIAGILITDLIMGRQNPWSEIYDPSRVTLSTAPDFIREGTNMAAQYFEYFTGGDIQSLNELKPGEGAIVRTSFLKVAVYKDEQAQVHAFSAVCPHLGCYVHWNNDEKSFDCPCHGSRFTCEGKVVNGPARSDLKPVDVNELTGQLNPRGEES
jgi:glycine/D-amino acid oxidase-like deaminating enzyme/nitrite reductase/ring-hydroxylating ferredoxin subunit